jgi:parallel beta-helix repeat protein
MPRAGRLFTEGYRKMGLKTVSGIMFTLLLTGMLTFAFNIQLAKASQAVTIVYVHPSINYATMGQTFSVNVSIANVTDLCGFELHLGYDTTILDIVQVSIPPFLNEPTWLLKNEIDEDEGWYWVAIATWAHLDPSNGSGTLVTLTFEVTSIGSCILDLYGTLLAPAEMPPEPIDHVVEDGYFEFTLREHDIAVSLDAPGHLMPGDSALLNATVFNSGLNNETDVELQLLVNESVVDSVVIDFLQTNSSHSFSYYWTPPVVEATYNVTAYALPVPNEDFTLNNMKSAEVPVSYVIQVPFHYPTIQEAIDAANPKDTILVSAGTYHESLTIHKSLTLVGEESTPIIYGSGTRDVAIRVTADNVDIRKFAIQNASRIGILVDKGVKYTTITSNRITNNDGTGIIFYETSCNTIVGNTVSNNRGYGIASDHSDNNTIVGNTVSNNEAKGISLYLSEDNTISGNTVTYNSGGGIRVRGSYNTISGNTVLYNEGEGITLDWSSNNTVEDNMILNNTDAGVYLYGYDKRGDVVLRRCCNNTIISNTVLDNQIGIYANHTENNVIYHNSFINNTDQVGLSNSFDIWDNGYEGNYWSDYAGTDSDGDGIGDNPYIINEDNRDRYPLIKSYIHVDLNDDGAVDIYDVILMAVAYGSYPGHPRWDLTADINKDLIIDIFDAILIARDFGKTI